MIHSFSMIKFRDDLLRKQDSIEFSIEKYDVPNSTDSGD